MKKFLIFLILIILSFGILGFNTYRESKKILGELDNLDLGFSFNKESKEDLSYKYKYFIDGSKYMVFFKFEKTDVYYDSSTELDFGTISEDQDYALSINAGYFTPEKSPVGLFIKNGELISPLSNPNNQITHIVIFNNRAKTLEIKSLDEVNVDELISDKDILAFQTGPLIIDSKNFQKDFVEDSINGQTRHLRSVLGFTADGEIFIGVFNNVFTLERIADYLLEHEYLKDKNFSAVNLDGGSSIALYSFENTDFRLGIYKNLPLILGFK